ncbi:MAG: NYN domain-containing protein, partial [Ilumatobacter sp.]
AAATDAATGPRGRGGGDERARVAHGTVEAAEAARMAAEVRARIDAALEASRVFVSEMERLSTPDERSLPGAVASRNPRRNRSPIPLPGGVISTSAQAAEHLVRADAAILIDGYNVAKLGWPGRPLDEQRDALVERTENLARRHGADVTIVFDGDSVVGAHAPRRRTVRIVFSPTGVTADDVIRSEVARLPVDRAVVVVTNDREIVADVRRAGANVVPSNAYIATL